MKEITMADKTLTLSIDQLDRLETLLVKAKALANVTGAADVSLAMDNSLSNTMWTITDFLGEAQKIIGDACRREAPVGIPV